tara:strand:- start:842 stop:1372 length:531 start_codon:yes stop_codon:yes gene_type:complete
MEVKDIFSGVKHVIPKKYFDDRGFFTENFNYNELKEVGIDFKSVQDNLSFSKHKGTIRGLHFQKPPHEQSKIIYVLTGEILDVFVDIRENSKTFGSYFSLKLNNKNGFLYIPKGFAHGFCTLTDNTNVLYKVDNYYNKNAESGIIWNDKKLNIDWSIGTEFIHLSDKDKNLKQFET